MKKFKIIPPVNSHISLGTFVFFTAVENRLAPGLYSCKINFYNFIFLFLTYIFLFNYVCHNESI